MEERIPIKVYSRIKELLCKGPLHILSEDVPYILREEKVEAKYDCVIVEQWAVWASPGQKEKWLEILEEE